MVTDQPEVKVMYIKSDNGIAGGAAAFVKLESKLPSLKGRKFYGVIFGTPPKEEYWACVAITLDDRPEKMDLEIWTIPGGKYAQRKIKDWNNNLMLIGPTFKDLIREYGIDPNRPSIEYYRSMQELIIRLPVK